MRGRGGQRVGSVAAALLAAPAGAVLPLAHPPTGNPGAWFGADSYPAEALRRNEQGRVVAILGVDAAGRVTSCTVTGSSGSAALDATTCRIAMAARRVRPAADARGRAVAATMPISIRWELPSDGPPDREPAPAEPTHREHRSWFWWLVEAHHVLPLLVLGWASVSRRIRRMLGWGVFDRDGTEMLGDRVAPRRRRPRLDRLIRAVVAVAPVVALAALLAWFDP